jgi:hypothetical protein
MHSLLKKISVIVFAALIVIQFFPPEKNSSTAAPGPNDITVMHPTPPAIKTILAESCYDCHSDNTRYPWYTRIQPAGWWMQHHVTEGIAELNFSQFGTYTAKRALRKLEKLTKETKDREMPLTSYLIIHREAKLTDTQIQQLGNWAEGIRARIPAPTAP